MVEAGFHLKGKIRIAIAGPGRLPKELETKIISNPDIFEFYNYYLQDSEVALLFQRASVCVLPYRQATQSSVPLISASFGVPVVATAVGAFTEDVAKIGGVLVPPGNPIALAEGILSALGRKPFYPSEFDFSSIAQRFVEWYKLFSN